MKLDEGPHGPDWTEAQVAEAFDCSTRSAERLRWRLVEQSFDAGLEHGCWLNMVEIELSVLSRQCMDDYFETRQQLAEAIATWERSRNNTNAGINWRFTTADARIKLKKTIPDNLSVTEN